jgi:hypothetical protein
MRKKNGLAIASAAATLILAGVVSACASSHTEKGGGDKVMCEGVNECKGKGSCATAQNSCAGENACKGKGAVSMTKEDCEKKGGKAQEKKM